MEQDQRSSMPELGRVTKLKPKRRAMADFNLEGCQGIKGDLRIEVSSDGRHTRM